MIVPGNHDHHLLEEWLERRRLEGAPPLGLEQRIAGRRRGRWPSSCAGRASEPSSSPTRACGFGPASTPPTATSWTATSPCRPSSAWRSRPSSGCWQHGQRVRRARHAGPERGSATPDDYERSQAPVYAFLFALAQAGGTEERLGGSNPSARVWQALGGGYSRAAKLRGWLLGTVAVPGAVGVANRLGLGPVRSDLSPGGVTRAGLAAIAEVERALDIEADHLIFGHTHRRGPIRGETGWRLESGTRLWNTGSWVYSPALLGTTARPTAPTGRERSSCSRTSASRSFGTCSTG